MNIWHALKHWLDRHAVLTDILMAVVLFVLVLLNLWIDVGAGSVFRLVAAIALILLTTLPLAVRRRFPIAVLVVIALALIAYRHLSIPESPFTAYCLLMAFVSAGVFGEQKWRNSARIISALAIIASLTYIVFFTERIWILPIQAVLYKISILLFQIFLFVAAWWIGEVFRIRREHEIELEIKTELLERETEEHAKRAIVDERVRIARELHDVVAHHVSVMGIQAAAARSIMGRQPEKVSELLLRVEESSRQAISELHRLLGFLRGEGKKEEISPQPNLERLPLLLQNMQQAGLEAILVVEGTPQKISPSIDLSAYRIIQEALTNTLKHAFPAKATVTVCYSPQCLQIQILDDGPGDKSPGSNMGQGRGLIGMRERVVLCDGEFSAGNAAGGGFLVKATFPLERYKL